MNDASAFLEAIRDDPDDVTTRLVFADWLEERGDPRGEFIRVRCALASWVPELERRAELQRREQELLDQHMREWLGPLQADCSHVDFHLGLPRLTLPVTRFLGWRSAKRMTELFRALSIESVRLTRNVDQLAALAPAPHLSAVSALDLNGAGLGDRNVAALITSRHVAGLGELDLSGNDLTDAAILSLKQSPSLGRLRRLSLRNNRIGQMGINALFGSDLDERLRRLDLHGNPLEPEQIAALGRTGRLVNSLGMPFALIPAGSFLMGSPGTEALRQPDEGPQKRIRITRPFYLGVFPVTQAEYLAVLGENNSGFNEERGGGPGYPAENVSWYDARAFCAALSALPAEKAAGRGYRLPTEAEWEYACRAGTTTPFHHGTSLSSHDANMHGGHPYFAPAGPVLYRTTLVGSYRSNAFGLYDMHGNVWEWCQDWYDPDYLTTATEEDPVGPNHGSKRTQRGGCFMAYAGSCRSAYRCSQDTPDTRANCLGLRVAMSIVT
jgi:uncharacterized protein (TIGR02996 family)